MEIEPLKRLNLFRCSFVEVFAWLTHLRYNPSEELVSGADGHADAGKAEAQALHAPDGTGDGRQDNVQHDVALEPVLVTVHDPARLPSGGCGLWLLFPPYTVLITKRAKNKWDTRVSPRQIIATAATAGQHQNRAT